MQIQTLCFSTPYKIAYFIGTALDPENRHTAPYLYINVNMPCKYAQELSKLNWNNKKALIFDKILRHVVIGILNYKHIMFVDVSIPNKGEF